MNGIISFLDPNNKTHSRLISMVFLRHSAPFQKLSGIAIYYYSHNFTHKFRILQNSTFGYKSMYVVTSQYEPRKFFLKSIGLNFEAAIRDLPRFCWKSTKSIILLSFLSSSSSFTFSSLFKI